MLASFGTAGGQPAFALVRQGHQISVFAVPTRRRLWSSSPVAVPIRAVAMGITDGLEVVAAGKDDGSIWMWDAMGERGLLHYLSAPPGGVRALTTAVLAGDSAMYVYACGADGHVRIWHGETSHDHGIFPGTDGPVNDVSFARLSGRDLLVTGTDGGSVQIWDAADGNGIHLLRGHNGAVRAVTFLDAGLVASGGTDRTVRLWDPVAGVQLRVLDGHSGEVTGAVAIRVLARSVLGTCSLDGTVRVWDPVAGDCLTTWSADEPVERLAVFDGRMCLMVTALGRVKLWDPSDGSVVTLHTGSDPATCAASSTVGGIPLVAAGFADGTVRAWDAASGVARYLIEPDDGAVTSIAFGITSGVSTLVCGTDAGTVRVHDALSGTLLRVPTPHTGAVLSLAFPRGTDLMVSGGQDATVRVWDAVPGDPLHRLRGHVGDVTTVTAGRSGDRVVVASAGADRSVFLWDAESGQSLRRMEAAAPVTAMALCGLDDRTVLATGGDRPIEIWDVHSGERIAVLDEREGPVVALHAHTYGTTAALFAGTASHVVESWQLPDGRRLGEVRLAAVPLALSFMEPRTLYVADADGLSVLTLDESTSHRP